MANKIDITQSAPHKWWPSPAKLNLFLHITGRDERGYHLLQSLFQLVDIGDQLAFNVTPTLPIVIKSELPGVPSVDNIVYKAAVLLQQRTNTTLGCEIWLKKVLPMGGGIGGGSSNAATVLLVLNKLWNTGLTTQQLADLGLELGADVPIFVHGHTAFAEGVGEKIVATQQPEKIFMIVFPNQHISTAEIFAAPDLTRNSEKIDWSEYQFSQTRNDCQKVVCERYPKVANLLRQLLEYAPSRMTGTGACLFSVFDSIDDAQQVKNSLPDDCQVFIAKGINRSPLLKMLDKES